MLQALRLVEFVRGPASEHIEGDANKICFHKWYNQNIGEE